MGKAAGNGKGRGASAPSSSAAVVPVSPPSAGQPSAPSPMQQQKGQQLDAKVIRANISALTACLKRLPSGAESQAIRKDITEKIECEKAKLRYTKPLRVRIEKTKVYLERRRTTLEHIREEIARLTEEADTIVKAVTENTIILKEMEESVQDDEIEDEDAALVSLLAAATQGGNPRLAMLAKNLQGRIKKEVVEVEDDDEETEEDVDDAGMDAYSDAYFGGEATWYALPLVASPRPSPTTPPVRPLSGMPTPTSIAAKRNNATQSGTPTKLVRNTIGDKFAKPIAAKAIAVGARRTSTHASEESQGVGYQDAVGETDSLEVRVSPEDL